MVVIGIEMRKSAWPLWLALGASALVAGVAEADKSAGGQAKVPAKQSSAKQSTTKQSTTKKGPAAAPKKAGFAFPQDHFEAYLWASSNLEEKNYDLLEKGAAYWRKNKAQSAVGYWRLNSFYEGLSDLPGSDEDNIAHMNALRAWIKKTPLSVTPRIALAEALRSWAWEARGSGYANTVSAADWKLFKERLAEAHQVLDEAKKLDAKCPQWWSSMQGVALGEKWPADAYEALYNEAIAFEPDYFEYYYKKMNQLLPRWYGEKGDAERFCLTAANAMGGEKGDILYARLVGKFYELEQSRFPSPSISFFKLDKGFLALAKQYPKNIALRVRWVKLSGVTGVVSSAEIRKKRMRGLFAELEKLAPGKDEEWREELEYLRDWVFQAPADEAPAEGVNAI